MKSSETRVIGIRPLGLALVAILTMGKVVHADKEPLRFSGKCEMGYENNLSPLFTFDIQGNDNFATETKRFTFPEDEDTKPTERMTAYAQVILRPAGYQVTLGRYSANFTTGPGNYVDNAAPGTKVHVFERYRTKSSRVAEFVCEGLVR